MMTPENKKRVQDAVASAGDFLKDKLPPHAGEGAPARNSYAHLWHAIKERYGKSYKECNDEDVDGILQLVEHCRNNPN